MLYHFQDEATGEQVEIEFSMKDPLLPSIGATVVRDGRTLRRVASHVEQKVDEGQYPYVSNVLPRGLEGCECTPRERKPIVMSRQHERELGARHGYVRD